MTAIEPTEKPYAQALRAAIGLPLLLLIAYSGCGWISSFRSNLPTLFFSFEQRIPFLPWMIFPYVSFHVSLIVAPLLCNDAEELGVYARRFIFVVATSTLILLVFPFRFGFERPSVNGFFSLPYRMMWTLDTRGNLFPSLHVAVAGIVWPIYVKHAPRYLKPIVYLWFVTIIVSTLFTYQHHLIDVIGGAVLALTALGMFRDRSKEKPAWGQAGSTCC